MVYCCGLKFFQWAFKFYQRYVKSSLNNFGKLFKISDGPRNFGCLPKISQHDRKFFKNFGCQTKFFNFAEIFFPQGWRVGDSFGIKNGNHLLVIIGSGR